MTNEPTYIPTGTGLCGGCGRDIGAHDDPQTHRYSESTMTRVCGEPVENYLAGWIPCSCPSDHPIHDVGRKLRCPCDWTKIIGAMPDFPLPEVNDD